MQICQFVSTSTEFGNEVLVYQFPRGRIGQYRYLATAKMAVLVILLLGAPVVAADATKPSKSELTMGDISVGFGGHFKVGRWTPVAVQITVERPCEVRWSVEVPDPYGSPTIFPGPVTEFKSAGTKVLRTLFRTGRLDGGLRVRAAVGDGDSNAVERHLKVGDETEDSLQPAVQQSVFLIAVLGTTKGLSDLPKLDHAVQVVAFDDTSALPNDLNSYDGLDALFINGSPQAKRDNEGEGRDWGAISEPQSDAIRSWVYNGGRLLLAVGNDTAGFEKSRLNQWVSDFVPLQGTRQLRSLSGLEAFGQVETPISVSRGRPVTAAKIVAGQENRERESVFDGTVLVKEQREPLVVRVACGFGRITFCGVNLDRPPVSDWKSLPEAMQQLLLDENRRPSDQDRKQVRRLSKTGISDLTTQLFTALEDFPQLNRTTTWTVMFSLLVYLLIIGPLDYFIVHRLFRNPWLTWTTFPVFVVAAAGLAIWTANVSKPDEVVLNQVDVVDIDGTDSEEQFVRTNSWMTVYSPQTQRNLVGIQPREMSSSSETIPSLLSWAGMPESGFGGMYRAGGIEYGRPKYHYAAGGGAIDDLPMTTRSTRTLTAARVEWSKPLIESNLRSKGYGLVAGTITHRLPGALREWMLAYGPGVYYGEINPRTGEGSVIEPGAVWTPDGAFIRQQELRGYLTRTRLREVSGGQASNSDSKTEYRLSQSEYDRFTRDPVTILRMITFYRRAGGEGYTGLSNDTLGRFDCSELLDLDRAILFGRLEEPATELEWNGKSPRTSQRSTFVRIVLPVKSNN